MNLKKHFAKNYLLASEYKRKEHKYFPRKDALKKKFIQFNALALTSLSIDIDNCDIFSLSERLKTVPTPSLIVETDRGFHIHYFLKYPISYKKYTLITWASHIRNELSKKLYGDKCAEGLKRLYRNPLVHSTVENAVEYTLADFNISYPKIEYKRNHKAVIHYDFSNIAIGERHTSLFNYLRTSAYKYSDKEDLEGILNQLAYEANHELKTSLPEKQIEQLVRNILKFMVHYNGKRNQTNFNRKLAQNKHKNTIIKVVRVLELLSLKKVKLFSNRRISRVGGCAPSTVGLHREEIINILTNKVLINIRVSMEEYKTIKEDFLKYLFTCTNILCVEESNVIVIDIHLKDYEAKKDKIKCPNCGKVFHRVYSSPSIKTNDGYKSND